MSAFGIDTGKAPGKAEELKHLGMRLEQCAEKLERMAWEMEGEEWCGSRFSLRRLSARLLWEARQAEQLREGLLTAAGLYEASEERLTVPGPAAVNPAYESETGYGGNQCAPLSVFLSKEDGMYRDLCRIVRTYEPSCSDSRIEELMRGIELEGCGYVALANTLFARYAGREAQFQEIFGFPMYGSQGELNHILLVTDLYCAEDDREKTGTTREDRERIWERYLGKRGIPVDVRNVDVTAENYEELSWEGEMIVGVRPCILFDRRGTKVLEEEGGHSMTVTGVTEDGLFRVSSWGMEYYIKPEDPAYQRVQFQQVCY